MMGDRWQSGDQITLRYTGHYDGVTRDRPGLLQGMPHIVVEDRDDLLALWMPKGSLRNYVDMADRSRVVPPTVWHRDTLRLMFPGKPYSVLTAPRDRGFSGWYVNLEAPFVRTEIGVDTSDNALDVVVAPDLSWRWKDEDTMQAWIDIGVFTPEEVERFYEEGRDAIAAVEARLFPFDGAYHDWPVPAAWGIPVVHDGWDALAGYDWSHAIRRRLTGVDHPR
jgi:predicted RNA-binding protein associated with RNAse of E/G family